MILPPFSSPEGFKSAIHPPSEHPEEACWLIFSHNQLLVSHDQKRLPTQSECELQRTLYLGSLKNKHFLPVSLKQRRLLFLVGFGIPSDLFMRRLNQRNMRWLDAQCNYFIGTEAINIADIAAVRLFLENMNDAENAHLVDNLLILNYRWLSWHW
jgi:hypothetical protein